MTQDISGGEEQASKGPPERAFETGPKTVHVSAWLKLSQFRLGLSDLFIILAFCAGLSLVYTNSWAWPPMTLLAIFLSLAIGFFFVMGGLGKRHPSLMLVWLFLSGVVLGCFGSSGLFWVSLTHAVGAILLCFVPREFRTPRLLMRSSMVMTVLALVYWTSQTPYHLNQLMTARAEFPVEDISKRLDFEHHADGKPLAKSAAAKLTLAAKVDERLKACENVNHKWVNLYGRAEDLKRIHGEEYEKFVRQLGFGVTRMRGIGHSVETPDLPRIDFASAMVEERNQDWRWVLYGRDEEPPVELRQVDELSELHFAGESDFLNSNMFGFVAKKQSEEVHVAGFVPHAFHDGIQVRLEISEAVVPSHLIGGDKSEFESLQLKKLELVSLLKFDKPKAYVLDHLPRMDELSEEGMTTRELTQFELNALDQLRSDEDVVIEQKGDTILMMGSLRSATHCLDCHAGSRGRLLGAFSYEFTTKN